MAIHFNHTIVAARDKQESAHFFAELFGLPAPQPSGFFLAVQLDGGVTLDYAEPPGSQDIAPQHYAFLVGEDDFDRIYGRILDRGLEHWADPRQSLPGEINHNDGGRGVYFLDPSGHYLEIITRPYGSGG
ncbi:VOC family protein [Rhodococcus triatomae]|uniref:Predicted dioxygenase of extradiol dioxygenase family n=1 Tax=Rhodococcus triatomae TaxID=300028 RepID=A0A1G8FQT5_9NOCA|nr:VOC family protein [Rhodococcus triatomae]QNG19551.1 VOC family protein [Rhodococcus triatomae]QNG24534.1 VOC family protein [Rhodococcus triatomae]SDH84465.1 Predicted dioxygenase of extradiol dioxygenase family [Rhodococcus triatomae]